MTSKINLIANPLTSVELDHLTPVVEEADLFATALKVFSTTAEEMVNERFTEPVSKLAEEFTRAAGLDIPPTVVFDVRVDYYNDVITVNWYPYINFSYDENNLFVAAQISIARSLFYKYFNANFSSKN